MCSFCGIKKYVYTLCKYIYITWFHTYIWNQIEIYMYFQFIQSDFKNTFLKILSSLNVDQFWIHVKNRPGERSGKPLQYSCLEKSMDRGPGGLQSMGLHHWTCMHEDGGTWVASNKLVELKKKKKRIVQILHRGCKLYKWGILVTDVRGNFHQISWRIVGKIFLINCFACSAVIGAHHM